VQEMRDVMRRYPKEYDVGSFEGGMKGMDDLLEGKKA
jgi:2-oxoisovalerate dehydrogenase E1 component alpha subunit